jgi:hypothetical protein
MVKRRKLQGNPRLSRDGKITHRRIDRLCSEIVDDGEAHPDDVRAAIRRVYQSATDNLVGIAPAPPNQSESAFLCLAFGRYLDGAGNLSLDQAFGLDRSRTGRPSVPTAEQKWIACAVWEQYLKGNGSLEAAVIAVGARIGKGKTQVQKFFYAQFLPGYLSFVLPRIGKNPKRGITPHETRRFLRLRKSHENSERRVHSTAPAVARNKDGAISVDSPRPHRNSRSVKPLPR